MEQLVSNYKQQHTNGAKLKPIASFLSETAREGMKLRVEARLSTSNPPDIIRKPMFTHAAALNIVKELRCIAASNINNTLTILGKEIREGRLQGAAPLDELAPYPGPDDTVTAPLSYLYFLNEVSNVFLEQEFTRNAKIASTSIYI